MRVTLTAPKEKFIPGRVYKNTSGSVLLVTERKSPDLDGTYIMHFYGVKNDRPHTWTKRAIDDLNSRGGRFELLEEGTEVNVDFAA